MIKIGFVCPTYKAAELDAYTRLSLSSFFETTPDGVAIVVDDGSKSWSKAYERSLQKLQSSYPGSAIELFHFSQQGGLTRSWNEGLKIAESLKVDYAIAGNNDIVFTDKWHAGLLHAVNNGYHIAGPLSNAPGATAKGQQQVERFLSDYYLTDNRNLLNEFAKQLYTANLGKVIESPINGFFQFAKMSSWIAGKYDSAHFYCPYNRYTSKGALNPTPLMTLNEDELQKRWLRKGMKPAIALSSFIFHYRSVTRGDKHKKGKWYRPHA